MAKSLLDRVVSGDLWRALRDYLGPKGRRRNRIADRAALQRFLSTRSNYMAQASVYGYLRTRAGTRFPELFASDTFVNSVNLAKWNTWLACLSDLSVFAGGLVVQRTGITQAEVATLMNTAVEAILDDIGTPADAGPEYPHLVAQLRARLRACDWKSVKDDESSFTESPAAVVRWSPVIDELKAVDGEIVRNSVRFRWQDVRRELRRELDAEALIASFRDAAPQAVAVGDRA